MNTMPDERSAANFERLPALLCRAEALHWSGWSNSDLDDGVKAGKIFSWQLDADRHRKYFRWQIGRLMGFLDNPQRIICAELLGRVAAFGADLPLPKRLAFHQELHAVRQILSPEWCAEQVSPSRNFLDK